MEGNGKYPAPGTPIGKIGDDLGMSGVDGTPGTSDRSVVVWFSNAIFGIPVSSKTFARNCCKTGYCLTLAAIIRSSGSLAWCPAATSYLYINGVKCPNISIPAPKSVFVTAIDIKLSKSTSVTGSSWSINLLNWSLNAAPPASNWRLFSSLPFIEARAILAPASKAALASGVEADLTLRTKSSTGWSYGVGPSPFISALNAWKASIKVSSFVSVIKDSSCPNLSVTKPGFSVSFFSIKVWPPSWYRAMNMLCNCASRLLLFKASWLILILLPWLFSS